MKRGDKVGYCYKKKNGNFFLIKAVYDDVFFPTNSPTIVVVQSIDKYGLYSNFQKVLKCKFNKIEVLNENYIFAIATKTNKVLNSDKIYTIDREGRLLND